MIAEGFKNQIVIPTLQALGMYSDDAVNLLLGTCATESDFGAFRQQLGGGPALGVYEMEEVTYRDCWRYIYLHDNILERVRALCPEASHETFALIENDDVLATVMTRIKYWMIPDAVPSGIVDLAEYWKQWYNTPNGQGTTADFLSKYAQYVITSPVL